MKITTLIKRQILKIIKKFGYQLKGAKKIVKHNDFDSIIKFLLNKKEKEKHIYFDVGANLGQSIKRLKKLNPSSTIHSFEPTPELYKSLIENFGNDKNVKINNLAVAQSKSTLDFYSYKYHKINSLIPIDKKTKFSKSRIIASGSKNSEFESVIKVDVTSIDNYCEENNINEIDFIKIDTQGSETDVLHGMKKFIVNQQVSIIELELILGFGYEKKFSFYDYEQIFNNKDYKLIALDNSGNIISNSNFQTNLLYVNKDIFNNIEKMHEENVNIEGITNKTDESHPFSY